jgi:hypothetical protein
MEDRIFSNYAKLDFSTKEGRNKIFAAVQYYATERPKEVARKYKAAIQAFGAAGDFPAVTNQILEKFHALPSYDNGFEEIFKFTDFTGTNESGFDVLDVEDGLTFAEVPIGEKALIYKMAGSKVSVSFGMYGAGLGWHRTLIDDKKYWTLEDNAVAFVNKAAQHKASCYYALIEALGAGYNITWQNPDPAALANTDALYTANRDTQTLNKAAETKFLAVKDKGYGVTPSNTTLIVLTPLQLVGRLNKALGLLLQGFAGSPNQVSYKFRLLPTTMLDTATVYYVCIPNVKAKAGNRMNLTIFNKFDEEAYADIAVGWERHGGAICDSDQFARCAIS